MLSRERESAEPAPSVEQALFDALCKVQGASKANDGPEVALARFARAVAGPEPTDADDFPDFSAEPPDAPLLDAEPLPPAVTDSPPPAADRDALVQGLLRALGDYQGLLTRYNRDFDEAFARRARGEPDDEDETLRRLRSAQALLVKYPVAAQAAFGALVREGRRFAATEEGRQWKQRLAGSPLLARARTLFEGMTGGVVGEDGSALPSAYVDAFLRALDRDLEAVLADLGGVGSRR